MYGLKVIEAMEFGWVVLSFRVATVLFLSMVFCDAYCICAELDYLGCLVF